MSEYTVCPCCGTKLVEYKHGLNRGLAHVLACFFEANGPAWLGSLDIDYTQYSNVQKLRYWGLLKPYITKDTAHRRGWWEITEKGKAFVLGQIRVQKYAITCQAEVVKLDGEHILFSDISDLWEFRGDYAKQVCNQATDQNQTTLF